MPFIQKVPPCFSKKAEIQLPKDGLKVDHRAIIKSHNMSSHPDYDLRFKCAVIDNTLTIERDDDYTWINGWDHDIYFRVYDPSKADEQVPESFDSSSPHPYLYHGLPDEQAPHFVKHVVVHESVKIILPHAFYKCTKMTKCTMHSGVERIEKRAFYGCYKLQSISLPKASLTYIGFGAFESCHVLGCIYVPPTVTYIGNRAFAGCIGAKMLVLPSKDDSPELDARKMIFLDCIYLLRNSNMTYEFEGSANALLNNDEMNEWMQHRYDHLPMHKLCADPHVTAERIRNFTKQYGTAAAYDTTDPTNHKMTPLHVLCSINRRNVNLDTIAACFDANPGALFTPDASNTTPLEYLEETEGNMHIIIHLMQDLTINHKEEYRFRPLRIAMRQCVAFVQRMRDMLYFTIHDLILFGICKWIVILLQLSLAVFVISIDCMIYYCRYKLFRRSASTEDY